MVRHLTSQLAGESSARLNLDCSHLWLDEQCEHRDYSVLCFLLVGDDRGANLDEVQRGELGSARLGGLTWETDAYGSRAR